MEHILESAFCPLKIPIFEHGTITQFVIKCFIQGFDFGTLQTWPNITDTTLNAFHCLQFHRFSFIFIRKVNTQSKYYWRLNTSVRALSLQWCHNGHDGVSNYQPHDCLLNRLFRCRSKKTSKLRVTGICAGNSPMTGEFPAQMASSAENVSIWWRHHGSWVNVYKSRFIFDYL